MRLLHERTHRHGSKIIMKNKIPAALVLFLLPICAQATPTIDAIYNTDILLVVGCALMFGFGAMVGK